MTCYSCKPKKPKKPSVNQDTDITRVVFRRFPKSQGGDLIAIFPDVVGDSNPYNCSSYMWCGQHGSCNPYELINSTLPVKMSPNSKDETEVNNFISHLENDIKYNLKVVKRIPSNSLELRYKELNRLANL